MKEELTPKARILKRAKPAMGFTLVEIMIVVAIIGVLSVIAIPSFAKARQTSRLNFCLENLRVYQGVLDQYAIEHGGFPSDLNELVTQGYLKHLYECPVGGAYKWGLRRRKQRYHLRCNGQHTPSINRVFIREDQPPTAR